MDAIDIIKTYKIRDLVPYAIYQLIILGDRLHSTAIFWAKVWFHGIEVRGPVSVWGRVLFVRFPGSRIIIERNVRIISRPLRYALNIYSQSKLRTMQPSACIRIGENVGFNSISILARSQVIEIGNNTMLGGNCQIMDTDSHPLWPPEARSYYPGSEHDASVKIGKNVFIGLNVIVLKGSQIGDNSVIGAGSVVNGRIPPNCIAAGVPAKVIRTMTGDCG
jgi:acetyltransferase-like isoleucine patch superfamily enzyme